MLQSLENLEKLRNQLAEIPSHELSHKQIEALAEADFRLAVAQSTPYKKAVDLLCEAMKFDSSNPKYAFHLGRLFFLHNDFDNAQKAFKKAYDMVPSNHRIWSNYAQMQWEMERRLKGSKGYSPNSLGKRADKLAESILNAEDFVEDEHVDCKPKFVILTNRTEDKASDPAEAMKKDEIEHKDAEKPPVDKQEEQYVRKRYTNKGQIRNSGIMYLQLEQILRTEWNPISVKNGLELLKQIAELENKEQSRSMFVLGAVQWLIRGYPTEAIEKYSKDANIKSALVDALLDVFTKPYPENIHTLAGYTSKGKIPVYTASVIHKVFAGHLEANIAMPFKMCYAKSYISGQKQNDDTTYDLIKSLCDVYNSMDVEVFAPKPWESKKRRTGDAAGYTLEQFADIVAQITKARSLIFDIYKEILKEIAGAAKDPQKYTEVYSNYQKAKSLMNIQCKKAGFGDEVLSAYKESLDNEKRIKLRVKLEECSKGFVELSKPGKFIQLTKKIEKRLKESCDIKEDFYSQLLDAEKILDSILTDYQDSAEQEPEQTKQENKNTFVRMDAAKKNRDIKTISEIIGEIEVKLQSRYEESMELLKSYDKKTLSCDEFVKISYDYTFKYAVLLMRISKPSAARKLFGSLKKINPMDPAIANNIAVIDTLYSDDTAKRSLSWETYIELLYFYPVITGDMSMFAEDRYLYHKSIMASHAPCDAFSDEQRSSEENAEVKRKVGEGEYHQKIREFLNAPTRVQSFTANYLLMYLNKLLCYKTPFAMLGISSSDNRSVREKAHEMMKQFNRDIKVFYPQRLREALAKSIDKHFDNAYKICMEEAKYAGKDNKEWNEDKNNYISFIAQKDMSTRLFLISRMSDVPDFKTTCFSSYAAVCLSKLDTLPLVPASEFEININKRFKVDASIMKGLFSNYCESQLMNAVAAVFKPEKDTRAQSKQDRIYKDIVNAVYSFDVQERFGPIISVVPKGTDSDYDMKYRKDKAGYLNDVAVSDINKLKKMCSRFENTYEMFFLLYQIYTKKNNSTEAIAWLKKAKEAAITKDIKSQLNEEIAKAETGQYYQSLKKRLDSIDGSQDLQGKAGRYESIIAEVEQKVHQTKDKDIKKQYQDIVKTIKTKRDDAIVVNLNKTCVSEIQRNINKLKGNKAELKRSLQSSIKYLEEYKKQYGNPAKYTNWQSYENIFSKLIGDVKKILGQFSI